MAPGTMKTTISVPWPAETSAVITFIDWNTKERFTLNVSFPEISDLVSAGQCKHVVFVIEEYDRGSVRCE
jgi:hypothetical protein